MEARIIPVGMGEIRFSDCIGSALVAYSLGSCIGLAVYDPALHLGCMGHIILPEGSCATGEEGKYASTCVPLMIEWMLRKGAARDRLILKMAGGARILSILSSPNGTCIGAQNRLAAIQAIERVGLRLASSDCGGDYGRTMSLHLDTGTVRISTATRGSWTI